MFGIPGVIRTPDLRLRNQSRQSQKSLRDNNLQQIEGAAYSPAYREIPPELAHLVTVWQRLPSRSDGHPNGPSLFLEPATARGYHQPPYG